MIKTVNLSKRFGTKVAVDDLNLEVGEGEVLGILGPNGAGKTTTIRMLAALIAPSKGEAYVAGYRTGVDDRRIRSVTGILTETPGFYDRLSAWRNLEFYAQMYEMPAPARRERIGRLLEMMGLKESASSPVGTFSKGMKQKLAIARALLHEPRVVLLDEPTSGLDPESARTVREMIRDMRAAGKTMLVCTHNLEEAERLSDRLAIVRQRLIRFDTAENLRRELFGRRVVMRLDSRATDVEDVVRRLPHVRGVSASNRTLTLDVADPERHNPDVIKAVVEAGGRIQFVDEERFTLEDVYLRLIGGDER